MLISLQGSECHGTKLHAGHYVCRPHILLAPDDVSASEHSPSPVLRRGPVCARHSYCINIVYFQQEAQLMLTNPRYTLSGQSRSQNIVPFHCFLFCNSNFVFMRRRFYDIRLQNVMTLKSGPEFTQRHRKWHHSKDCVWFPISVL